MKKYRTKADVKLTWVCAFKNKGNTMFKVDDGTLYMLWYRFAYSKKKKKAKVSMLHAGTKDENTLFYQIKCFWTHLCKWIL